MICNFRFHARRNPERLVDAAKVVVGKMQCRSQRQAQELLLYIVVVPEAKQSGPIVRAFVNVTKNDQSVYTSISDAMSDKELREQLLDRALFDLGVWRKKYLMLKGVAEIYESAVKKLARKSPRKAEKLSA